MSGPEDLLGFSVSVRLSSGDLESPPVTRSWRRLREVRRIMVEGGDVRWDVKLDISSLTSSLMSPLMSL